MATRRIPNPALTLPKYLPAGAQVRWNLIVLVAVGGGIGAVARFELCHWLPDGSGFPGTSFAVNTFGGFAFGACAGAEQVRSSTTTASVRVFLMFGVLGGMTSFSVFAVQAVTHASTLVGVVYLIATPIASLVGVHLGVLARRVLVSSHNENYASDR